MKKLSLVQIDMLSGMEESEAPGPIPTEAFATWNEMAKKHGWKQAAVLGHGRPDALRRAIKELGGVHQWRALLEKCGSSDFLCGRAQAANGRKPFAFTIDWALKPANLLKLREGNYFESSSGDSLSLVQGGQGPDKLGLVQKERDPLEEQRRMLRGYRPGGYWPYGVWKRPEDPMALSTGWSRSLVEEWRKRHGVVVSEYVPETRLDKLQAMAASYRKVGNHARAEAIEVEIAELTGEPLVTAPRPSKPARVIEDFTDIPDDIPEGEDFGSEEPETGREVHGSSMKGR